MYTNEARRKVVVVQEITDGYSVPIQVEYAPRGRVRAYQMQTAFELDGNIYAAGYWIVIRDRRSGRREAVSDAEFRKQYEV